MKVSEMMNMLMEIQEQRGDIEVVGLFGPPDIEVLEGNEAHDENEAFDTCLYIG